MTTSTFKGRETIYRQDAIEAIKNLPRWVMDANGEFQPVDPPTVSMLDPEDAVSAIENLPSAQPDLSEYSDKLWRNAYERGKRDAQPEIIRCKDCKYYREYGYVNGTSKFLPKCTFNSIYVNADDFCSRAERKEE